MKDLIVVVVAGLLWTGCQSNQPAGVQGSRPDIPVESLHTLMRTSCYACHNPNAPSHDALIAPPLAAIKYRYQQRYTNRETFVAGMSAFMKWPSAESALMPGAVSRFGVMPATTLTDEKIRSIAVYIYDNEVEKPAWFDEHFESEHGKGRGFGR